MSVATDLCDAIVDTLNAADLSMAFTAERRAVPFAEADFKTLRTVQVYVLANTRKSERRCRGGDNTFRLTYKPVVIVQKKLTPGTTVSQQLAESDELQGLAEEIESALALVSLVDLNFLGFNENQDSDVYGVEAMRSAGVFTVPITVEYTN